jgi:hypothetical protein
LIFLFVFVVENLSEQLHFVVVFDTDTLTVKQEDDCLLTATVAPLDMPYIVKRNAATADLDATGTDALQ